MIKERLNKIEDDLKSDGHSDAETHKEDRLVENDQTSLPEEDNEQSEVDPSERQLPKYKSSFQMLNKDESKGLIEIQDSKALIDINESKESMQNSHQRSTNLVAQSHVFETSEKSTYNGDLRESNERPLDMKLYMFQNIETKTLYKLSIMLILLKIIDIWHACQ